MFADVLVEGGYLEVIISRAQDGVPDVRRMLRPLGPVAVFAASNFPFAFSVAGGDTASALAAGCTVVLKVHEAHPATSHATHDVLLAALGEADVEGGILGLVYGGHDVSAAVVRHPAVTAVGFTGSLRGGRALMDIASARPDPIPFFGELGSSNPAIVLPDAAARRTAELAQGYVASLCLGVGQYCTNPGLLFVPAGEDGDALVAAVAARLREVAPAPMLTPGIRDAYQRRTGELAGRPGLTELGRGPQTELAGTAVAPVVFAVDSTRFTAEAPELSEECFGPTGIVVRYGDVDDLDDALRHLPGALVGVVHGTEADSAATARVAATLERRCGRLVHNGWPTGVAVNRAMHHGGPWPATNSQHTSVGATAVRRWLSPVCYQSWPEELLPAALRDTNPWQVPQRIDG
jgi:NADP-dependent aldehyde dehydrogenase